MLKLLIFSLLYLSVSAKSVAQKITADKVAQWTNTLLGFSQFIDEPMLTQLQGFAASPSDIAEFTKFLNNALAGKYPRPNSRAEALQTLAKEAPAIYARISVVQKNYEELYSKLSPLAKQWIINFESAGYAAQSDDHLRTIKNIAKVVLNADVAFKALPEEVQDELGSMRPKLYTFYKSTAYDQILSIVDKLETVADEKIRSYIKAASMFIKN